MSEAPKAVPGTIAGLDLTVPDAAGVRDFYASVIGWNVVEVDMGGYADYAMTSPAGDWVAGVCHARGPNADLPPQWLVYINVADLDESLRRCAEAGGTQVTDIKGGGKGPRYCVIRDPAGAMLTLLQPPAPAADAPAE